MSYLIRKIYRGFLYKPDAIHFHPGISILILLLQFLILLNRNIIILVILMGVVITENIITGNNKGTWELFKAIFPLFLFLGIISLFFAGIIQATLVTLRLLTGAFLFSFFFAVTNPADLTRMLEYLKIPSKWAILPTLSLTLVPRISKDAEEAFVTLFLRGEIKGYNFFRWLPKVLSIYIASVLFRAEFLSQSLYYRGFGLQKRSHYKLIALKVKDIGRFLIWCLFFIISIIYKG